MTSAPVRYRCGNCGNRTRFDVYEQVRRRRFVHFTLAGDGTVEEEETLDRCVERVVCRWCDQPAEIVVTGTSADRPM